MKVVASCRTNQFDVAYVGFLVLEKFKIVCAGNVVHVERFVDMCHFSRIVQRDVDVMANQDDADGAV